MLAAIKAGHDDAVAFCEQFIDGIDDDKLRRDRCTGFVWFLVEGFGLFEPACGEFGAFRVFAGDREGCVDEDAGEIAFGRWVIEELGEGDALVVVHAQHSKDSAREVVQVRVFQHINAILMLAFVIGIPVAATTRVGGEEFAIGRALGQAGLAAAIISLLLVLNYAVARLFARLTRGDQENT